MEKLKELWANKKPLVIAVGVGIIAVVGIIIGVVRKKKRVNVKPRK